MTRTILLDAVSTAEDEQSKAHVAREILEAEDLGLSVQVLQECGGVRVVNPPSG